MSHIYTNLKTNKLGLMSSNAVINGLTIPKRTMNASSAIIVNISTMYIEGSHIPGTNVTINNPYSLYINSGNTLLGDFTDIYMGRITGSTTYSSGEGMELYYNNNTGYIRGYGYTSGVGNYKKLSLHNTIYITDVNGNNGVGYVGINTQTPTSSLVINYIDSNNKGILRSNQCIRVTGNSNPPSSGVGTELYFNTIGYITVFDRSIPSTKKNLKINNSLAISPNKTVKLTTDSTELNCFYANYILVGNSTLRYKIVQFDISKVDAGYTLIVQSSIYTTIAGTMLLVNWLGSTTSSNATTLYFVVYRSDSNNGWTGTVYLHYIAFVTPNSTQFV